MASIQKDPKTGKWYCRVSYKDQNGVRRQKMKKGFSTKKEASIAATRLEKAVYDRVDIAARDVVFADYFERWVRSYKSGKYGTSTELKYLREVDYVRKYFGAKKLSDLTRSDLQSYINQRGKNKSKDTIEKAYNKIKNCLKMALADGLIIIDPTYQIELVYNKSKRPKLKYFNKQEAQKLQAALSQEVDYKNAMLLIALRAGLRIGEIYGLKWEDIDKDQLSVKRGYDYNYTKIVHNG